MFEALPVLPTIIFPSSLSVICQPVQSACCVIGGHCNHVCVCEHSWMTEREYRELRWRRRSGAACARCGGVEAWNFFMCP